MRQRRMMNQINVVPYIDVMLVLLVIFMVTAPMLPSGTVDLPSVAKTSQAKRAPMEIVVKGDDDWTLRDRDTQKDAVPVDKEELIARLIDAQRKDPEKPVVIAADKRVRYEAVMKVMDLLQRNQIAKIGLLVHPVEK
ncbi:MAG: protein TolR [Uliginosibacterium sp.]|jgi:biopolymer transport protein TolR|nr:protein TolR [Uliginosibacterium sp.]MBK9393964.1 protein TolR [Uliginosibacterium sp.]MBK9615070.1 protein TolR [Uliginosibacterium sp.]